MINRFLILLLACFATNAIADNPFSLWQVAGEKNSVYILGSVHLLRAEDHPLPTSIDRAYADAEAIYMEIDMDDLDPLAAQAAINRLGVIKGEDTLETLMGAEAFAAAVTAAEAIDIPIHLLQKSEPWLAAMTVEQMSLARIGFNPAHGVEMAVLAKARGDSKPIYGFEELEEQLQFLDSLSLESQRDMLLQTLGESQETQAMMDDLILAWRNGDTRFFEETVLADLQKFSELYDVIVKRRNEHWVEEIEQLLDDDDDYLIVVGVLHLIGDDGLPRQLEKLGYNVSQLSQE